MGCCCSSTSKFKVRNNISGQDEASYEMFQTLHLTDKELDKIYTAFRKFDLNETNDVDLQEFLTICDLRKFIILRWADKIT